MIMPVINVTDATFETEVINADLPVLVDFGTDWFAPCKQIEPTLISLSEELAGKVKIVKVHIDDAAASAMKMGV
jgi:thioredoxin 1